MKRYEYTFGVYVDAENEQEAWEKVRPISEALDRIDAEGDSSVEGPTEVTASSLPNNPPHNALRAAVARGVAEGGAITEIRP